MKLVVHKAITGTCVGMLAGILVARQNWFAVNHVISVGVCLCIFSAVAAFCEPAKRARPDDAGRHFWQSTLVLGMVALGFGCALLRANVVRSGHSALQANVASRVSVQGTVTSDPTYHTSGQFEFFIEDTQLGSTDLHAKIKVRSYVRQIQRGDRVNVEAKLYDGFASWQGSMYFADVDVLGHDESAIARFRAGFINNIYSVMPDPEASLGLGFLIGVRSLLPDTLVEQLSIVGLTHIVAVSGYNLTILVSAARRIFGRLSRFQSLLFSSVLIGSFVMITGWSPSILRAVIVSGIGLVAWYVNRPVKPWLLILYSSSFSALLRPTYVWYDIGWYLSLTAFIGVLVVAPLLTERIYKNREPGFIAQILLETTSAQIITVPVIMYVFGELSLISLLSNLLVLPLIPLAMFATFLTGITYFLSYQLAWFVMWPTYYVLAFITNITAFLAQVDWALIAAKLSLGQMVGLYLTVAVTFYVYARTRSNSRPSDIIDAKS